MDRHHHDLFENAQKPSDKGKFMKLPRFQKHLKYNLDALYSYSAKIAHVDLPARTIVKLGRRSPTSTTHYNYARRFLEDRYDFQELMSS